MAITVTSFTDFIVFALGATTVLPALRSFCLWCSVGIIIVYFFQATLFTALLSLDLRRLNSNRNGLCPCYVHKTVSDKPQGQQREFSFSQKMFKFLAKITLSIPGSIVVMLVTFTFLGVGIWGMTELEQEFDPIWFLPPKSELYQWFDKDKAYFPTAGVEATVYITEIDWDKDLDKVGALIDNLKKETNIIAKVDDWYTELTDARTGSCNSYNANFSTLITCFLFSSTKGFASQGDFEYRSNAEIECGEPAPELLLGKFSFTHQRFNGRDEHIPALKKVKDLISNTNNQLTGRDLFCF